MTKLNQQGREVERARLLRVAVPLLMAGVTGSLLFVWIAIAFSAPIFFLGELLCGAGAYLTSHATRIRLRSINHDDPETLAHFAWLLAGLVSTLSGFVIPICLS